MVGLNFNLFLFCRYVKYIPREFLQQGYQGISVSGLTNSCLFESASLIVYRHKRPNFLATVVTGVAGSEKYADEVNLQ